MHTIGMGSMGFEKSPNGCGPPFVRTFGGYCTPVPFHGPWHLHGACSRGLYLWWKKKKKTSDFYGFEIELGYARHIDSYDQSIEYIRGYLIGDCKLMARHGKFHIFPPSWVISRTKQSNCICESVTMAPAPSPVSKFLSCHLASGKSRRTDDD